MKPSLVALALSSAIPLACVSIPPHLTGDNDPANPGAQEAPVPRPTDTLTSDPPPPVKAQDSRSAGGMGMEMEHGGNPMEMGGSGDGGMKMDMGKSGDGGMKMDMGNAGDGAMPMPMRAGHRRHRATAADGGTP